MAKTGVELIADERRRQVQEEGYDATHDHREPLNFFVAAAVSYTIHDIDNKEAEAWWPWNYNEFKPKDRKRNLIRAGALIAAALDKMQDEENFEKWKAGHKPVTTEEEVLRRVNEAVDNIKSELPLGTIRKVELPPLVNLKTGEHIGCGVLIQLGTKFDYDRNILDEFKKQLQADDNWYISVRNNRLYVHFKVRF